MDRQKVQRPEKGVRLVCFRSSKIHVAGAERARERAPGEGVRWGLGPGPEEPQAITEEERIERERKKILDQGTKASDYSIFSATDFPNDSGLLISPLRPPSSYLCDEGIGRDVSGPPSSGASRPCLCISDLPLRWRVEHSGGHIAFNVHLCQELSTWAVHSPELSGCLFTGSQRWLKFQAF